MVVDNSKVQGTIERKRQNPNGIDVGQEVVGSEGDHPYTAVLYLSTNYAQMSDRYGTMRRKMSCRTQKKTWIVRMRDEWAAGVS